VGALAFIIDFDSPLAIFGEELVQRQLDVADWIAPFADGQRQIGFFRFAVAQHAVQFHQC
jgi:hypothetical protein